ncbi:splicing regulator SDE2-like [Arctopsyche grandis]|uniref:splicing regulator SDE2-like n=1 Tax=Arctopsyche grandis TaxID=121162 RepID=UPI00406D7C12
MASSQSAVFVFLTETSTFTGIPIEDLYCTQNGKKINLDNEIIKGVPLQWAVRLVGGKGGFGSMLRAIGAQIEKTTNREACRDLSGRRLRDIREERRLLDLAASQSQREEIARQRKEERIKRLCAKPKYEFNDEKYEKSRRGLEEAVDEAVEQGSRAGPSTSGVKAAPKRKKPAKLWIDDDMSDLSSSESDNEDCKISSGDQASESDGSKNEDEPVIKHSRIEESTVKATPIST